MKKKAQNTKKACSTCINSGRCKYEVYFKDEKINSCPDYKRR